MQKTKVIEGKPKVVGKAHEHSKAHFLISFDKISILGPFIITISLLISSLDIADAIGKIFGNQSVPDSTKGLAFLLSIVIPLIFFILLLFQFLFAIKKRKKDEKVEKLKSTLIKTYTSIIEESITKT
ncbi:MAG: hypothetical protein HUU01_08665 [Saprospiraceae bacterium]|nr:hypothetical protein [Saprospiraceae bacterium]